MSRPVRVAWIEILLFIWKTKFAMSRPVRVAWIEIRYNK